jgi:hypothetical protein
MEVNYFHPTIAAMEKDEATIFEGLYRSNYYVIRLNAGCSTSGWGELQSKVQWTGVAELIF